MIEIIQSESVQRFLFSLAATAITAFIGWILTKKPNVKWGISHGFTFTVKNKADEKFQNIQTASIFIQNTGRATAENIEIHFNYQPEHFQIWPTINYETMTNPEGRYTIKIENLAPKEAISIEMLSLFTLPEVLRVRLKHREPKCVDMMHFEAPSKLRIYTVWILIWLGVFCIMQNIFLFVF